MIQNCRNGVLPYNVIKITGSPDVLLVKSWPLGSCYLRIILRV